MLPLHLELKLLGETSFLDIRAEFDLHNLEVLVEKTEFFLFLLSKDIFSSEYCRKGIKQEFINLLLVFYLFLELTHAVACKKPIVVLREQSFVVTEVPNAWKEFEKLLTGPRTLICSPKFLAQCASQLKNIRNNSIKNSINFYKPEDKGKKIKTFSK